MRTTIWSTGCLWFVMTVVGCTAPPGDLPESSGSKLRFRISESPLYPEGIAHDTRSGDFFLSSLAAGRILRIAPDGSWQDFLPAGRNVLLPTLGMKVDAQRRILWVCSADDGDPGVSASQTGIFAFDVDDASPLGRWLIDRPSKNFLFNDVALARDGTVYATTFEGSVVYRLAGLEGELERLVEMPGGAWNNGIALDDRDAVLFVAGNDSIYRYDLASGAMTEIPPPRGESMGYSDGLYFVQGSLVAVQSLRVEGGVSTRIARLDLDPDYTAVERVVVLEQDHAQFAAPTTGVVVEDRLVYIATSYLDRLNELGPEAAHPDVLLLDVALHPE